MKATTERRLVTALLLGVGIFAGGTAGWVGGTAMLGFALGAATALLGAAGAVIVTDLREQEAFEATLAEGWAVVERCKAQLDN